MASPQVDWLIIDGYSLVHRVPELKALFPTQLLMARQQLIRAIERTAMGMASRVTMVFDGKGPRPGKDEEIDSALEVVFSPGHLTADTMIERMVASHPQPDRILVVTSDRLERNMVSASGAQSISCGDFWRRCQPPPPTRPIARKKPGFAMGEQFPD